MVWLLWFEHKDWFEHADIWYELLELKWEMLPLRFHTQPGNPLGKILNDLFYSSDPMTKKNGLEILDLYDR